MAVLNDFIEKLIGDDSFCEFVLNTENQASEYWEKFIKEHPDKLEEIEQAKQYVRLLGLDKDEKGTDESVANVWYRLQNSIASHEQVSMDQVSSSSYSKHKIRRALRIAASIILLSSLSYLIYEFFPLKEVAAISHTDNYFERSTLLGQKATFYLPDGSQVMLNAGSSIKYYECIDCNTRELILEGEGYFNIKEDPNKPFIVKTKNINTTVLGTSFNVRAYKEEDEIQIALVTGKVSLTNEKDDEEVALILMPNHMASYNKNLNTTKVHEFDHEEITGWKDKILVFKDVSFRELTNTLSRWYGVDFVLQDSTKKHGEFMDRKDYRGKYNNKSLQMVLEAISFSYDFEYEIDGKTVLIK